MAARRKNANQVCKFTQNADIILASQSPRRKELLAKLGLSFVVEPTCVDESKINARSAKQLTKELSKAKARAAGKKSECVIGADTVVALRGKIYGKPHTAERARAMLAELQGKRHIVYTGVTVIYAGKETTFVEKSSVKLNKMSSAQIASYVERRDPLDKAGAYGIQDNEVVKKYRGSYSNIVGLPLEKLARALLRAGVINGDN